MNFLKWIDSYLVDREQRVIWVDIMSSVCAVTSGVPQSEHLSPLLLNLFINHVCDSVIQSKCLLYADDLEIFSTVTDYNDCINIQKDINMLERWCNANFMYLNVSKNKVISFYKKRILFL